MSAVGDLVALYIIPRVRSATDSVIIDHISGHVKQSGRWCVCVSMYVDNNFRTNDLWLRYSAFWFISTLSRSSSKVEVIGHFARSRDKKFSFLIEN